jgi:hypothetical protein
LWGTVQTVQGNPSNGFGGSLKPVQRGDGWHFGGEDLKGSGLDGLDGSQQKKDGNGLGTEIDHTLHLYYRRERRKREYGGSRRITVPLGRGEGLLLSATVQTVQGGLWMLRPANRMKPLANPLADDAAAESNGESSPASSPGPAPDSTTPTTAPAATESSPSSPASPSDPAPTSPVPSAATTDAPVTPDGRRRRPNSKPRSDKGKPHQKRSPAGSTGEPTIGAAPASLLTASIDPTTQTPEPFPTAPTEPIQPPAPAPAVEVSRSVPRAFRRR